MSDKNTFILELASYEKPEIIEDSREDWVEYGTDNLYYDWLIDRYHNSPTNNSVINNMSRLIYGRGIGAKNAHKHPNEYAAVRAMFSNDTLRKVIKELKMLGMAHFQVLKKGKKVVRAEHIETNLIRPEKCNEAGQIEAFYYSNNWEDVKKYPPQRIPAFSPDTTNDIEIMCIKPFTVGMKYFAMPDYEGCLPYAVLEEEIADFLINHVQRKFSGTKVVNFNNGIPSERQMEIQSNKVKAKLTGSKGDPLIISFNKNAEERTTIDDIPLDDAPQHYEFLSRECRDKILNCHNVTSPMLVGIQLDGSGFSSNAEEIETAARYFYNATIKSFQDLVIDAMDQILAVNGIALDLYFKRLNFLEEIDEQQQQAEQTQEHMQEVRFNSHLEGLLSGFGEEESEEWELIDARDVDYDLEEDFDKQIAEAEEALKKSKVKTGLSKILELVGTGRANPNAPSEQDKEVDGFHFKVRYKYVGNESPERDFCKAMMRANKIYKKEDIVKMDSHVVNSGHGHDGEKYSIWLYKGGVSCHHKWERRTYVSARKGASIGSNDSSQVSTGKAREFGYRVTNEKEVSMMPKDMPRQGHHPNYGK
jgi:hypothetical protein